MYDKATGLKAKEPAFSSLELNFSNFNDRVLAKLLLYGYQSKVDSD